MSVPAQVAVKEQEREAQPAPEPEEAPSQAQRVAHGMPVSPSSDSASSVSSDFVSSDFALCRACHVDDIPHDAGTRPLAVVFTYGLQERFVLKGHRVELLLHAPAQ